jgi:hypothetical protein
MSEEFDKRGSFVASLLPREVEDPVDLELAG